MRYFCLLVFAVLSGCATKTICANGVESYRPVLDPSNACKVRIRQVIVGSEIKLPKTASLDSDAVVWGYEWTESEFKAGRIELGHIVLVLQSGAKNE